MKPKYFFYTRLLIFTVLFLFQNQFVLGAGGLYDGWSTSLNGDANDGQSGYSDAPMSQPTIQFPENIQGPKSSFLLLDPSLIIGKMELSKSDLIVQAQDEVNSQMATYLNYISQLKSKKNRAALRNLITLNTGNNPQSKDAMVELYTQEMVSTYRYVILPLLIYFELRKTLPDPDVTSLPAYIQPSHHDLLTLKMYELGKIREGLEAAENYWNNHPELKDLVRKDVLAAAVYWKQMAKPGVLSDKTLPERPKILIEFYNLLKIPAGLLSYPDYNLGPQVLPSYGLIVAIRLICNDVHDIKYYSGHQGPPLYIGNDLNFIKEMRPLK